MPLQFPSNPTTGQTYQSGSSATYQWNGMLWSTILPPTQVILAGTVPNWTSAGTIQAVGISATTSAPTMPTTTLRNNISYRQLGAKTWEVVGTLNFTDAAGSAAGTGDYLFTLPAGLRFDTTQPMQPAFTGSIGVNNSDTTRNQLPGSTMFYARISDNYTATNPSGVIIWDATRYRVSINNNATSYQCWGSSYCAVTNTAGASWRFTFQST